MSKIVLISIHCNEYNLINKKLFKINGYQQPNPIDILLNSDIKLENDCFKKDKLEEQIDYDALNTNGFYIGNIDYNFNPSDPKFGEAIYVIDIEHINCKRLGSKIRDLKLNKIFND